jgi:hypothetical protein
LYGIFPHLELKLGRKHYFFEKLVISVGCTSSRHFLPLNMFRRQKSTSSYKGHLFLSNISLDADTAADFAKIYTGVQKYEKIIFFANFRLFSQYGPFGHFFDN